MHFNTVHCDISGSMKFERGSFWFSYFRICLCFSVCAGDMLSVGAQCLLRKSPFFFCIWLFSSWCSVVVLCLFLCPLGHAVWLAKGLWGFASAGWQKGSLSLGLYRKYISFAFSRIFEAKQKVGNTINA